MLFMAVSAEGQSLTGTWMGIYNRDHPADKRSFYYRLYLVHHQDSIYGIYQVLDAQAAAKGISPNEAAVMATYSVFNYEMQKQTDAFVLYSKNLISVSAAKNTADRLPPTFLQLHCQRDDQLEDWYVHAAVGSSLLPITDNAFGQLKVKKVTDSLPAWVWAQLEGSVAPKLARHTKLAWPKIRLLKKDRLKEQPAELLPLLNVDQRKDVVHRILETESTEATLELYDNGMIDDDTVSLYFNGQLLIDRQKVAATPLRLTVKLEEERENRFVIFAHNEGRLPPNTALLVIKTGADRHELTLKSTLTENAVVLLLTKQMQAIETEKK